MSIQEFVHRHVAGLIAIVAENAQRASADTSDEGVHDLRVAIRRLSESLRVFEDLFPRNAAKSVRRDLRAAMRLAGKVRNHDIARELMIKGKFAVPEEMDGKRAKAARKLQAVAREWNTGSTLRAWQEELHG